MIMQQIQMRSMSNTHRRYRATPDVGRGAHDEHKYGKYEYDPVKDLLGS
jgi:hypothetical protein